MCATVEPFGDGTDGKQKNDTKLSHSLFAVSLSSDFKKNIFFFFLVFRLLSQSSCSKYQSAESPYIVRVLLLVHTRLEASYPHPLLIR